MPQEVIIQIEEWAKKEFKLKKDTNITAQQDLDFRMRDNQTLTGALNLNLKYHLLYISYLDEGVKSIVPSDKEEYESDSSSSDSK